MMEIYTHIMPSPVGPLTIRGNDTTINEITFKEGIVTEPVTLPEVFRLCIAELEAYFAGTLETFTFPIEQQGTPFQQSVWQQLIAIPYGHTISYLQLAKRINNPKSIRAVGTTNGKNQLVIVVPCHRVIGSNGSLVGFGGGLWRKKWLLDHEMKKKYGSNLLF
ncbi:methylated-DNA-[protein]-cysteine S-methyltransferase [Chitinophaga sp. CF118]|uniref:methylated-DNA--[protein]-cysteine S-methyltransferase n=1 Tax=Chitinophaga sp. CF118 TaxID=1884367 RepID=UPI0008EF012C|nr:methylated-DNA--[protein]-cysteine S-methyltransferase [Chitinophaga sp. CF118]SFF03389.1 methylated-DNA-[protein]-cysteine S-methyltransferase [Chitinophaga sp. CF118]